MHCWKFNPIYFSFSLYIVNFHLDERLALCKTGQGHSQLVHRTTSLSSSMFWIDFGFFCSCCCGIYNSAAHFSRFFCLSCSFNQHIIVFIIFGQEPTNGTFYFIIIMPARQIMYEEQIFVVYVLLYATINILYYDFFSLSLHIVWYFILCLCLLLFGFSLVFYTFADFSLDVSQQQKINNSSR